MALSRPFKEDRLALPLSTPLSPPVDRWCEVLDFVPAGSVSSFSTFQSFRFQEQLDQQMLFSCLCGNITVMFDRTSKTQFSVHRFRVDSFFFLFLLNSLVATELMPQSGKFGSLSTRPTSAPPQPPTLHLHLILSSY